LFDVQESLKLLYREVDVSAAAAAAADDDDDEYGGGGRSPGRVGRDAGAAETWNEQTYRHVDVIAADHVFTDNTDAVANREIRSVPVNPGVFHLSRPSRPVMFQANTGFPPTGTAVCFDGHVLKLFRVQTIMSNFYSSTSIKRSLVCGLQNKL